MKKRHYIELGIILLIAVIYLMHKAGIVGVYSVSVSEPTVMTVKVEGTTSYYMGADSNSLSKASEKPVEPTGWTEVSFKGQTICQRSVKMHHPWSIQNAPP